MLRSKMDILQKLLPWHIFESERYNRDISDMKYKIGRGAAVKHWLRYTVYNASVYRI